MRTTIKYVTGFPKGISPSVREFDRFRKHYHLTKRNVDVSEYRGSLTSEDFSALCAVLTSQEYFSFSKSKNVRNKQIFLKTVKRGIERKVKLKTLEDRALESLPNVSENFLKVLGGILDHENAPLSYVDSIEYLTTTASKRGLYIPISLSYPYHYVPSLDQDLDYTKRVLIFLEDHLEGEVTLRKTKRYEDLWAGTTEEGIVTITIGDNKETVDWNWWQSNSLRWTIDPTIRSKILKEKEDGVIFTRL